MKKRIFLTAITCICVFIINAQNTPQEIANHIAQKMKDTLRLNGQQKNSIYNINMQLHNQKMIARQQYAGSDSLGIRLQQLENTRDSLYHPVLTWQQYIQYREKKKNLVSSN